MRILDYRKDQKALRTPGRLIKQEEIQTSEFQNNLKEMFEILKQEKNGIGLAATQADWNVQLFILNCDENLKPLEKVRIFINPIIESVSKATLLDAEACLSFPGLNLKIKRPQEIVWKYWDLDFQFHQLVSKDYYARAILHEVGHLQGKLFVDYASSVERLKFEKWLKS